MKSSVSFALAIAVLGSLPIAVAAQDESNGISDSSGDDVICMARPKDNSPQVRASDRGKPVFIAVVPRAVPGLEARGFSQKNCSAARLRKPADLSAYRDQMCETASLGNEAVQNQLARVLGEYPSVLCAYAERVAGQWQRIGKGRD